MPALKKDICTLNFQNLELQLLPEKAIFINSIKSLFIADPHFGKAAHFRKAGIPIPENLHEADLFKIQNLITLWKPTDVYFLGDLFHSDINEAWFVLEEFVNLIDQVNFHLIKGNHDILPEYVYRSGKWKVHDEPLQIGQLILSHEPMERIDEGNLNLCGHIHPGISLKGVGKQHLKLPCFFVTKNQIILPAFGRFTGLANMKCTVSDRAFVIADQKVIPII